MLNSIKLFLRDERGSAASSVFTAFFVMIALLFTVFMTTIITSYITYNRFITEIEQNLDDAAAKAEKSHLFLAETDEGSYKVNEGLIEEVNAEFSEMFLNNLQKESERWKITNEKVRLYTSDEDGRFAVCHEFTCHLEIRVSLFGKLIDVIDKDISLFGQHQFAEIIAETDEDATNPSGSVDTGENEGTGGEGESVTEFEDVTNPEGYVPTAPEGSIERDWTEPTEPGTTNVDVTEVTEPDEYEIGE